MKMLLEYKKITIILIFVFLCGLLLQISRASFLLTIHTDESTKQNYSDFLEPSAAPPQLATNPDYCIAYDDTSMKLKNNVEQTLNYLQKTYKTFDLALGKVDFLNCSHTILTTAYLKHLGAVEEIERYIQQGGKLFLLSTLEPDTHFQIMQRQLGIIDYSGYTLTKGVHLTSNVLLGATGETFLENNIEDSSLKITLHDSTTVYAQSPLGNPLLWKQQFGKGMYMIFNSNFLSEKHARGFLTGILSLMDESFIYPIFNAKTFHIDDFPAPFPKGNHEVIYEEYKQDIPTFFQTIWWPDMIQVANRTNLIYTGLLIQTYNDRITPPFQQQEGEELDYLIRYGRELVQSGGELGLHGYNHQPFTMDTLIADAFGYNRWTATEDMKASISEVLHYIDKAFPSYQVRSYVPPSNVLSLEGRIMLKETLPDLLVISSLYSEDGSKRSYVQEFEVANDGVVEMPRISSGYFPTATNRWEIANAITSLGVFSHFVHPDDVISDDRSNGGWSETFEQFEQFIDYYYVTYPWLRAMTTTNAAYNQAETLHNLVQFEEEDDKISGSLERFVHDRYFILRTTNKIKHVENGSFEKIDSNTYLICANAQNFTIFYKESP